MFFITEISNGLNGKSSMNNPCGIECVNEIKLKQYFVINTVFSNLNIEKWIILEIFVYELRTVLKKKEADVLKRMYISYNTRIHVRIAKICESYILDITH